MARGGEPYKALPDSQRGTPLNRGTCERLSGRRMALVSILTGPVSRRGSSGGTQP